MAAVTTVDAQTVRRWFTIAAGDLQAAKDHLTALDAAIGDADHGLNIARGFSAVADKANGEQAHEDEVGAIFKVAGMTLMSTVGGASGMLYGNFFLRAAATIQGARELTPAELSAVLQAGLLGIVQRGRAVAGDKTMVDAWTPALAALAAALGRGEDLAAALRACADAAEAGMNNTVPLVAKKGRASYLGERSAGHMDPGAASTTILLRALCKAVEPELHIIMIGIVIVSHSALLAQGVLDIVEQMVQERVPLAAAGGTDIAEAPIGTDPFKVLGAIDSVYSDAGVLVLMDLGSALMSAEAALDMLPPERRSHVVLCEAPLVEGAVAASVRAMTGGSLQDVLDDTRGAYAAKVAQLTSLLHLPATEAVAQQAASAAGIAGAEAGSGTRLLTIVVPNRLGLHARPAARLVSLAAQFDAQITIAHDSRTANATSMNQVATLGVRQGDLLVVGAAGPQAEQALAAIEALALDNFGDPIDVREPAEIIAAAVVSDNPHELAGIPAAEGIAFGPAFVYRTKLPQVVEVIGADPQHERQRLEEAIAAVAEHLTGVRASMLQRVGAGEASIFDAHLLMVRDTELLQAALQEIELRRVNAEAAWQRAIQAMATRYQVLTDPYMARRADDIIDVGQRVLRVLGGTGQDDNGLVMEEAAILVAHELKPSDLARVQPDLVLGIITELGSASDHSAILARALGLPAVTGLGPFLANIADKQTLALDGSTGQVWLAPDAEQLAELERKGEAWAKERAAAKQSAQRPATMRDGQRIMVAANINGPSDVAPAIDLGAEGVGLFRTEYLFIDRLTPPTEEEQVETYRAVARQLKGRPLVIRTLDVGGDKPLPYVRGGYEANPFLGQRGLRYSLDRPAIFKPQMRAILRLAAEHPVKIMFPMVSTFDELVLVDALIEEACAELQADGLPFDDDVPRGIMIETPAAVMAADYLARLVDFFSIGTNDLSQYMMAADRSNPAVASLVSPYQPAVVRAIYQVVQSAQKAAIPVSLCGELAGDPRATPLLVGLGITELSMSAPAIPLVKARIRQVEPQKAHVLANELLTYESAVDIEQRLSE